MVTQLKVLKAFLHSKIGFLTLSVRDLCGAITELLPVILNLIITEDGGDVWPSPPAAGAPERGGRDRLDEGGQWRAAVSSRASRPRIL